MTTANRTLPILLIVLGALVTAALLVTMLLDRVPPEGVPTLEDRRLIDGDPTPPDRPAPPTPPIDRNTTPTPVTPPPR